MIDTLAAAAPAAAPSYAELLTHVALRRLVWAGGNRGERKILLLRLCDDANDRGVVTVNVVLLAAELRQTQTAVKRLLAKLITRGDLTPLHRKGSVRTFQMSPRL